MKVADLEIGKCLGNTDVELNNLQGKTLEKLVNWRNENCNYFTSIVDYLLLEHHRDSKSIREIAREVRISHTLILKIFSLYNLPKLSHTEAAKAMLYDRWQDQEFRKRNAKAVRTARLNPENVDKYYLPTINGYRRDIQLNTQSCWEANLTRVLLYTGREFAHQQKFRLRLRDKFRELFNGTEVTETNIDFTTIDNRGNFVLYEIMSHPLEDEKSRAKLEMVAEQYAVRVVPISLRFYRKIESRFKERINDSSYFAGWEDKEDNLRTNSRKYA